MYSSMKVLDMNLIKSSRRIFWALCMAPMPLWIYPTLIAAQEQTVTVPGEEAVAVNLAEPWVEGGDTAPARAVAGAIDFEGRQQAGATLTLSHRASASHVVGFATQTNIRRYNTLVFKAKFSRPEAQFHNFNVMVRDKDGNWALSRFASHAKKLTDGWYEFAWDIIYQPDVYQGADYNAITAVQLQYSYDLVPQDETVDVTLTDMKFVSGRRAKTGNPELFTRWEKYIAEYKPDYSDSSKYLMPPTTGRIAASIALTSGANAAARIIVPRDAKAPLALAGQELSHWLGEITGASFPVTHDAAVQKDVRLLVGTVFARGKFDEDLKWLEGSDGFAVRTRGKDVFIFGSSDKGTLNGVFTFLENNSDIIWPRPQREMNVVYTRNPALKIVWGNDREKPATRLRGWATNLGLRPDTEIWEVRNRGNYPKGGGGVKSDGERRAAQGSYVEYGGGHNISGFIGKRKEFFPVIDGEVPETFNIWKHQPNFTAPGIVDAVAENVLTYIKEKAPPNIGCININIEDNWGVSTDTKSLEPIALPDGMTLQADDPAFRSTQFYIFLNAVTKKINAVYPNLNVGTYAYFFTATPPKVPLDPRIRVYFCPYVRKDHRTPLSAPINDYWWLQLEDWAKATPNIVIREYYGVMNGFRPLAEVVSFDVKSYLARGVKEYTAELNPDESMLWGEPIIRGGRDEWTFMAMDYWVIQRLYWNPNQDVEQLRKYYLRRTYHEAAPFMEKFFGSIRTEWFKETIPSSFEEIPKITNRLILAPGHEAAAREQLTSAAAATKNATSRMAVEQLRMYFEQWVSWTKDPAKMQADTSLTLATALQYGWGSNTDWGDEVAWCVDTVTSIKGKTVPALRLTVRDAPGKTRKILIANEYFPSLTGIKNGSVFSFTMHPATAHETIKSLQVSLTAIDKNDAQIHSAAGDSVLQADGSLKVHWKLTADGQPFDATQLKRLEVTLSNELFGSRSESTFFLTDMTITPPVP
jgi:hypothetical protein